MKRITTILIFSFLNFFVFGQVKADLEQLNFMTGNWVGSTSWGDMEEYWSKPMGDNMICSYRCVKNGKVVFYEFIVVEQSASGVPMMKLRHFGPGNIAKEEKDKPFEYPLAQLKGKKAVFESGDKKLKLIYERLDENQLRVVLDREKNGVWVKDEFLYTISK